MKLYDYLKRGSILMSLAAVIPEYALGTWDGEPSIDDINFNMESFIDINSYQFRRSEQVKWYDVENGLRISAGSLETNLLYLSTDLRLKQDITPNVIVRLNINDEEFFEPREFPRPLLELEYIPTSLPVSLSLIGNPAYAKRDADLGFAVTVGQRPWNYFRAAWLNSDYYFNDKNELDESYYKKEPSQLTLEAAYNWEDRYKLRISWQDNNPLELVFDDQIAVFAYENQNYQATFDYRYDTIHNFGLSIRGFETSQSHDDSVSRRSQDIRYFSIDGYWFLYLEQSDEWTLGMKYDDFINEERTPEDMTSSFDFTYTTIQIYSTFYHPYSTNYAWELGLHIGRARQKHQYLDPSQSNTSEDRIEAKLRTAWELFSSNKSSALTFAMSFNLDELKSDPFDGGSIRLQTKF